MVISDSALLVETIFNRQVVNLGDGVNPALAGIYSPRYDKKEEARFMTRHYTTDKKAQAQATSWDMTSYYHDLLTKALKRANFDMKKSKLRILDIGCGFGSSTFPLLDLFPTSRVIASDFSIPMLHILKEKLEKAKQADRCELLQLNAEELDFKENSFDLIVGAAVLHHLFSPDKTIAGCAKILKPGGLAIFFEPFDEGTNVLRIIYLDIINHPKFKTLSLYNKVLLRHIVSRWRKMRNSDKSGSYFRKIDDKWFFKKSYFETLAKKNGFASCAITRIDTSDTPYTNIVKGHFGNRVHTLPPWVFEIISEYETWLTTDMKDALISEGCLILQKK